MADTSTGKTLFTALVGANAGLLATVLTPFGQSTGEWIRSKTFGCRDSIAVVNQLRSLDRKGIGTQVFDVNGDGVDDFMTVEPTSAALEGTLRLDVRDACNPDKPRASSWPTGGRSTNLGYADRH